MNNIKQNLTILLAAVEAQPEERFNLRRYKAEQPCGTIFCTVGLACTMPHFTQMGFSFKEAVTYDNTSIYYATLNGEHVLEASAALDCVFGRDSWNRMFSPAGCGSIDAELWYDEEAEPIGTDAWGDPVYKPNMTDKELAIRRLKRQIELYSDE